MTSTTPHSNNHEKELKDEIIAEVIDDLQFNKVKLQEFKLGMIDHIYLMEKTYDKAFQQGYNKRLEEEAYEGKEDMTEHNERLRQQGRTQRDKEELEFLKKAYKLLPFSKGLRMIEERIKILEERK